MGQAKARGSKAQRVAEAIERKEAALKVAKAQAAERRKAQIAAQAEAHEALERENAARQARGEKPMVLGGARRKTRLNASLALAVMSSMANIRL